MLCAVIKTPDLRAIEEANQKADLIELRLDLMGTISSDEVKSLRSCCHRPVIFAGGEKALSYLSCHPDFIDIPVDLPLEVFREVKKSFPRISIICSLHDYEKTPQNLTKVFEKPADLYKIATFAHSSLDGLRVLQCIKHAPKPTIGLCMGEVGAFTRILAPIFGSPFTYAPLSSEQQTAPGQFLLEELKSLYRHRHLNPKTGLYGLIGDPVSKSMSHFTHNITIDELGLDAIYVKLQVKPDELAEFIPLAMACGFKGLSVTMPLKEAIIPYLDLNHSSCGAVNTLAFHKGYIEGWNTDGVGALNAIEKKEKVNGKHIVIIGAGGTARALAQEAIKRGGRLTFVNRTLSKAEQLAKEFGCEAASLEDFSRVARAGYDQLFQCTPVGMNEKDHLLIPLEAILPGKLVFDAISNPSETPLLLAAKQKKCPTVSGQEMFTQQAVEQFCLWFLNNQKGESQCLRT